MQSLLNSDHIEMDEEAPPSPPRVARSIPLSHTSFYSVEYPGYVAPQSVPKAVERLGGPHNVTETFKRGLKIDLRLKDNDLWAHPPTGQTVSTHNLLLKVVRRKRKQGPSTASSEDSESLGQFTTEVMGMIPKTIRFRSKNWSTLMSNTSLIALEIPSTFNIVHQRTTQWCSFGRQ